MPPAPEDTMRLLLSDELRVAGKEALPAPALRARMEERFAWAVGRGLAAAVLACQPVGLERAERGRPGVTPRIVDVLTRALGPAFGVEEALVLRDATVLVVLLVGPDPGRLEGACRQWVAGGRELRVDGVAEPVRVGLQLGYAVTQPGKRLFLDTLIHVAREGLGVARCRGGGACVHTMLYDIWQDRLESERGTQGLMVTASAPLVAGAPTVSSTAPRAAPAVVAHAPQARATGVHSSGNRERELLAAMEAQLEAQRRENEALRARLQSLESGGAPQEAVAPPASPDAGRIDLLERRLAKLMNSLEAAEERLARVADADSVDLGIPSCYRTVQGLDADTPQRALKFALMRGIFDANLQLRERLRVWREGSVAGEWRPGLEHGV